MNLPAEINLGDIILEKGIPEGTERVVVVSYRGRTLVVPVEMYKNNQYRIEFIKKFGFPPPSDKEVTEVFSPNIQELIK